jgi:hypothetical protein
MADTYTEFLNLTKPEVGGSRDSWGVKQNDNLAKLDAWAKATAASVTAINAAYMPKAGGVFGGQIGLAMVNPQIGLTQQGSGKASDGKRWGLLHFAEDGALYLQHSDMPGDNPVRFTPAGELHLAGQYNVKAEIAKAAASGAAALNSAVRKDSAARQDIQGDFLVSKGYPTLGMNYPNVFYTGWQVRENAGTYLMNMSNSDGLFMIGSDGSVWCKQLGDFNNRIESRAQAWAEQKRQEAYNQCVSSLRLAYAGDLYNSWNLGGGFTEPYAGAVMTTRLTYTESDGTWNFGAARWRYLQLYNPSLGGWVTAYYS